MSEAVTHSVVHGYKDLEGECDLTLKIKDNIFYIKVEDHGVGISNIEEAMQPFFTTGNTGERSGMGFTVMQSFMDTISVNNQTGGGTVVTMQKNFTKDKEKASGE